MAIPSDLRVGHVLQCVDNDAFVRSTGVVEEIVEIESGEWNRLRIIGMPLASRRYPSEFERCLALGGLLIDVRIVLNNDGRLDNLR